jgi:hypothetical protein
MGAAMDDGRFIVFLIRPEDGKPFKHFRSYAEADIFARRIIDQGAAEATEVHLAPGVHGAREAVAALQMGACKFLAFHGTKRSPQEVERDRRVAWEWALKHDPDQLLKMLGL